MVQPTHMGYTFTNFNTSTWVTLYDIIFLINNKEVRVAWGEVKVEDRRKEFIYAYQEGSQTLSSLCCQFEISRKNAYKWINRFDKEGLEGLKDRSRARLSQALETDSSLIQQIIAVRIKYPSWGPKKVYAWLQKHYPDIIWPSTTTIGKIFDRNGLIIPRKYRRHVPPRTTPLGDCIDSNDVWCMDFKGYFLTKDGQKCDPFTLTDAYSRFLIRCVKLDFNRTENVWGVLDASFREYGLPLYLRSDNGPPFATCAPGRVSRLSINLIKVGVIPDWIEPGKPQQNGRHERMHLTLKNETANPPAENLNSQRIRFQEFQDYYNFTRPHEALDQKTPSEVYECSNRKWDGRLRSPEYSVQTRKVMKCGCIGWRGKSLFISEVLYGEYVGIEEQPNGEFEIKYGPIILGKINADNHFNVPLNKKRRSKKV